MTLSPGPPPLKGEGEKICKGTDVPFLTTLSSKRSVIYTKKAAPLLTTLLFGRQPGTGNSTWLLTRLHGKEGITPALGSDSGSGSVPGVNFGFIRENHELSGEAIH